MYIALNPNQKWRNNSDWCNYRLVMINTAFLLHAIFKASHCRLHTRESILHLINANSQILQNSILSIARTTSLAQTVSIFFLINACVGWFLAKQPISFICSYGFICCACAIVAVSKLVLSLIVFLRIINVYTMVLVWLVRWINAKIVTQFINHGNFQIAEE